MRRTTKASGMVMGAVVMAEALMPGIAHAQASSYSSDPVYHAVEPNTPSYGVAFMCVDGLNVDGRTRDNRSVEGEIDQAIVIPVENRGNLYMTVIPTDLITPRADAVRALRADPNRSFVDIPGTSAMLETTGNDVTGEFVRSAANGDAVFALPAYINATGMVYPDNSVDNGRIRRPVDLGYIADLLGSEMEVQSARRVGPGRTFWAAPIRACG